MTFAQIRESVECLAAGLQKSGLKKGDRIGVLGKNTLEYFLLYGAAAAAGAIMLPISWRLSAEEICFNLNDGEPRMLFADREYQPMLQELREKLRSVKGFYSLEGGEGEFSNINALMESGANFEKPDISPEDGFVIIHTAAVAGRPRGALLSHGNVLLANMHLADVLHLGPQDVYLGILPLFHVAGLSTALATFQAGCLNVNVLSFDASKAVELIEEKGVSVMVEFSPMLASILEQQEKTEKDISSLRAVVGLDTPETIERYQGVTGGTYYCLYGQTETSSLVTFTAYNEKPGSAGKLVPLARMRLVDDHDRPVPRGKVGEITVKGPMVFKGYWNLPEENAYTFRGGWHHTGDLGRFDEEGFLWYEGRKPEKELIKPGGENVYPAEVEKVILEHPAVMNTVVFGVPDPKWKEGIKAVCLLKEGESLDPQALIDFVGRRIARYKKPQYVVFAEELPLLEDGSPDRAKIKDLYGGAKQSL
jgi:long-chain acyl-CoA synthetase